MQQQPGYPNPQYGYVPPPPQRSAIPKVIGILMIIFGAIGLLGGLIGMAGGLGNDAILRDIPEYKTLKSINTVTSLLGLAQGAFQLYVGIRCVGYKPNAPSLAKVYAILGMVIVVVNIVITMVIITPMMEKAFGGLGGGMKGMGSAIGGLTMVFSLLGFAWPVVILALMSKQTAKAACVDPLAPAALPAARVI